MPNTLGERIAQARRELGVRTRTDVNPSDVAEALGVSPATVYRWESNEKSPRDDTLAKLAKYLGVTPAYLRYGVVSADDEMPRPGQVTVHRGEPAAKRKRGGA